MAVFTANKLDYLLTYLLYIVHIQKWRV